MDLLQAIQEDVMKQKAEEADNLFSRVADFREFISTTSPAADVTVTLKCCCLSSERLNGGRGTRVTCVDASQHDMFDLTAEALGDLTPLKKKRYVLQVTVWDAKPKEGSLGNTNMEFHPGAVYTFRNVDGVGFYAEIAKGSVEYERDNNYKVFEEEPPLKKRKVVRESTKKVSKNKVSSGPANVNVAAGDMAMGGDIDMESKTDGAHAAVITRSRSSDHL